jgi:hypothetical protein
MVFDRVSLPPNPLLDLANDSVLLFKSVDLSTTVAMLTI